MDPKATIEIINDRESPDHERQDALMNLAAWIARGGFVPHDGGNLTEQTINDSMLWPIEGVGIETANAVAVAIAYGDVSAMVGLGYEIAS